MMGMDAILLARTWAVYNRSRPVLSLLVLGGLLCYVPALVVFNIYRDHALSPDDAAKLVALAEVKAAIIAGSRVTTNVTDSPKSLWILDTCFVSEPPQLLGMLFLVSLLYESEPLGPLYAGSRHGPLDAPLETRILTSC